MGDYSGVRRTTSANRHGLRLLHTSDLHIGLDYGVPAESPVHPLRHMVTAARNSGVDVILVAGDLFEHNRVPDEILRQVGAALAESNRPVILLPGNHDPCTEDSVYVRGRSYFPENVHILQRPEGETLYIRKMNLQVWGRPHVSYHDYRPLDPPPSWPAVHGERPWRVVMAHGHFVRSEYDRRHSYQIEARELARTGADYVALGHWDVHVRVGDERVASYYAGSPCRTGRYALVTLSSSGVRVEQVASGEAPGSQQDA